MFKKGDKVLLVKEAFEKKYTGIYAKWNGKPLTVSHIDERSKFPIRTFEGIDGNTGWMEEELMFEKVENEL